ncbi:hypothetical protein NEUTE1DRAFT_118553 [Neurospora tetrasperma FGSC 2508]|uniref:Uncharacterized protein n=1 Tax=Neurospora tetrasperma (strain FGSC 2508 / ATCC MYA-4615 / P0657) TaxID=510951 RepID=F8N3W6_NEUT8|nr:uncharacterized protein NEUTE1DRAFT_118553 [Neurospora tetrasperma FGSC 2508]EGO51816.1 hypothetical protein NEUTE1DRAFT_118553 [Neurospora tetrasperma FGSC 2508]
MHYTTDRETSLDLGKIEERLEVLASLCVVDIGLSLLSGMALGITSSSSARGVCV